MLPTHAGTPLLALLTRHSWHALARRAPAALQSGLVPAVEGAASTATWQEPSVALVAVSTSVRWPAQSAQARLLPLLL